MRILIAEDNRVSRQMLVGVLEKAGYEPIQAADGADAWQKLQQADGPKLAIIDWMMPEMDGLEVVRRVRKMDALQPPYLIMLTSKDEQADIIAGLDAGADDYLTKPFDAQELRARIRVGMRIIRLQSILAQAAQTDSLTGLHNRAGILRTLQHECSRSMRDGTIVGIAMIDIDHFKKINDTYGHPAGDDVLRELAERCETHLRPYDSLGRYGGEEFLAVAPECPPEEGPWERLRRAVAAEPFETGGGEVEITISVGAAYGYGSADAESLVQAADRALYEAKDSGRNQVQSGPLMTGGEGAA